MTISRCRPQSTFVEPVESVATLPIHQDFESLRERRESDRNPVVETEDSVCFPPDLNPYRFDPEVELATPPKAKPVDPSLGFSWLGTLAAVLFGVIVLGGLIVLSIDRVRAVPIDVPEETNFNPDLAGVKSR